MTEASRCIYTLICPLAGPATNHCPGNGLGHLWIVECPNVHIISLQLIILDDAGEDWLIASEPYDRISTKRNANKPVQDLISVCWVYFLMTITIMSCAHLYIRNVDKHTDTHYIYIYIYIYIYNIQRIWVRKDSIWEYKKGFS